ncbi:NAD(P)-binding protein [Cadophora sp. DSE1049]|nr:NAD(P)-binding protein [Cadophora sp. DSE1049]
MPSIAEVRQYLGGQIFGKPFVPNVDLSNKTYVTTGGNTGLGLECAKHLANLKAAKIILACRNIEKGEKAKKSILEMKPIPNIAIAVWHVDQSNFKSVLAFGERLKTLEKLHGFIANAGLETVTFERTEGYENSLTVNVISTIMLSVLALPKLKETAKANGARTNLVIVGSIQHVFAPSPRLDIGDGRSIFEVLSEEKNADMMGRYELSKLMVQMCEKEIAERLDAGAKEESPVVVSCINPGWCATELSRYYDKGRISDVGAWRDSGEETHGQYLSECLVKTESSFVRSKEGDRIQKRLWKELCEIIERLSPGATSAVC